MNNQLQLNLKVYIISMGSATEVARGGHGPPQERIGGGASNAFGPPPKFFWENSVMKHN